jgi:hypothetical protein
MGTLPSASDVSQFVFPCFITYVRSRPPVRAYTCNVLVPGDFSSECDHMQYRDLTVTFLFTAVSPVHETVHVQARTPR